MRRAALRALAAYDVVTGLWPLVSMRSFERVTGPKTDHWLVKTVGTLALANGVVLGVAASRRRLSPDAVNLGVATALAFVSIDTIYVLRGRISSIYLADAVLEALFIVLIVWSGGDDAAA